METTFSWLAPDVLESIQDGFVFLDREMRYVYANEAALGLLRKSREEIYGRYVWDVFPQAPVPFREALNRAAATGEPAHVEALNIRRGIWYDAYCYPSEQGLSTLFRDVTEKRLAEEKLAELAEQRRLAIELAELGTWTFDATTNEMMWDERGRAINGVGDRERWPLAEAPNVVHPDDLATVKRALERTMDPALREPYWLEHRIVWPDGSVHWIQAHGTGFFDGEGPAARPLRAIGTVMDITGQKLAEERARFLAEASDVLSSSLDFETTLRHVAQLMVPRLADWFGIDLLTEDGGLERAAAAHVDPEKVKWALEMRRNYPTDLNAPTGVARVIRTGQPEFVPSITDDMLVAAARDDEHLRLLRVIGMNSVIIVPLRSVSQTLGVLIMVWSESGHHYIEEDVSFAQELARRITTAIENARLYRQTRAAEERLTAWSETLEQRVRERTAELDERNEELQNFASAASHDLQEPLRKVKTFIELLKEEIPDPGPTALDYLARIDSGASRMSQFITDLLALSRVATRGETLHRTDLNHVVADVLSDLDVQIQETGGRVETEHLCILDADATQMRQLFQNLIGNALKFRRDDEPPHVRISCEKTDEDPAPPSWRIIVEDNGIGFEERYAERIFQPFQRLHGRSEFPGTGMGLAIVRRIVERHGGSITARSAPREGSTFILTLPETHASTVDAGETGSAG
jgi:PAS domain S-box-containing protein